MKDSLLDLHLVSGQTTSYTCDHIEYKAAFGNIAADAMSILGQYWESFPAAYLGVPNTIEVSETDVETTFHVYLQSSHVADGANDGAITSIQTEIEEKGHTINLHYYSPNEDAGRCVQVVPLTQFFYSTFADVQEVAVRRADYGEILLGLMKLMIICGGLLQIYIHLFQ